MSESNTTYQHNFTGRIVPSGGLTHDPTTNTVRSETTTMSPKGVPKSIRRRSRVSKRTPTTHLNANTSNFRALVQQFTGCPRLPFSHGSQKGPINLSFGNRTDDNNLMAPSTYSHHYTQRSDQPLQQPQQQEWCNQDQQQGLLLYHDQNHDMLSSDSHVDSDVSFSSTIGNFRSNLEVYDNYVSVNGYMNSGYYF